MSEDNLDWIHKEMGVSRPEEKSLKEQMDEAEKAPAKLFWGTIIAGIGLIITTIVKKGVVMAVLLHKINSF